MVRASDTEHTLLAVLDALASLRIVRMGEKVDAALRALQTVRLEELARAIERRDVFAIHDLAARLPMALPPAARELERAFRLGVRFGGRQLVRCGVTLRFDAPGPKRH